MSHVQKKKDRRYTCAVTSPSAEPLPLEFAYPEQLHTSQDDAI